MAGKNPCSERYITRSGEPSLITRLEKTEKYEKQIFEKGSNTILSKMISLRIKSAGFEK